MVDKDRHFLDGFGSRADFEMEKEAKALKHHHSKLERFVGVH
jgi:hypothetical protein